MDPEIVAWAWKTRRRGGEWMKGWALGHIKPTRENCHLKEGDELEVRPLFFAENEYDTLQPTDARSG